MPKPETVKGPNRVSWSAQPQSLLGVPNPTDSLECPGLPGVPNPRVSGVPNPRDSLKCPTPIQIRKVGMFEVK